MVASQETITEVISAYERAAEANRQTQCRSGNLVEVAPDTADEVMVTADLHGNRLNFKRLVEIAALAEHPHRHLVMQEVCHGGPLYPSGSGCMSHMLLEDVAALKLRYPDRFHFLLSNHELAEWTDFPIVKSSRVLNLQFRCGLREMYGPSADRVRAAMIEFLSSCPLAVRAGSTFVCHSLPDDTDRDGFDLTVFERKLEPEDLKSGGAVYRLVWGRDLRLENAAAFARLVGAELLIHGHVPCQDGYAVPNEYQIILDCCGERACYVVLPLKLRCDQAEIVRRIRRVAAA